MVDQIHPSLDRSSLALILSEMLKSALEWEIVSEKDPEVEKSLNNEPSGIDYPPAHTPSAKALGEK